MIRKQIFCEYRKRQDELAKQEKRLACPLKLPRKIGRNDLCPCGSGKKFKKCCGNQVGAVALVVMIVLLHVGMGAWMVHWAKIDYQREQDCQRQQQQILIRIDPNGPIPDIRTNTQGNRDSSF